MGKSEAMRWVTAGSIAMMAGLYTIMIATIFMISHAPLAVMQLAGVIIMLVGLIGTITGACWRIYRISQEQEEAAKQTDQEV